LNRPPFRLEPIAAPLHDYKPPNRATRTCGEALVGARRTYDGMPAVDGEID